MYWVMFVSSWELSHVRWSESRVFMMLTRGGAVGPVMLLWNLNMYRNTKVNFAVVAVSHLMLGSAIYLDRRSQTTVQYASFMSGMISHHALATIRAERSELREVRVCEPRGRDR